MHDASVEMSVNAAGVHRPYFRAAIAVTLTAGAVWGAALLLRIAFAGSFTAVSIHEINAHGHAQIFGWVGLFVMGFAYRMFVPRGAAAGPVPNAPLISLALMVSGIVFRTFGEPLYELPALRVLALVGSALEIAAIAIFLAVMIDALRPPDRVIPAERPYVLAAFALFLLQAVYEAVLLFLTTGAGGRQQLLALVSTWQGPLRDLQIHGFALLMILGVGLRFLPRTFGFVRPPSGLIASGWISILLAVAWEIVGFVMMRTTGDRAWIGLLYAGIVLLATTSLALTWRWLPGMGPASDDRSVKFVRAAITWLAFGMGLLVLAPVYLFGVLPGAGAWSDSGQRAVEIGFSHAYYGAVRHALTVGFVSSMILGVGARIVPILEGRPTRNTSPLWLPFALVQLGCALRVTLQVATDFAQPAFALVGASGLLEVTGLALWGTYLWREMSDRGSVARPAAEDEEQRVEKGCCRCCCPPG